LEVNVPANTTADVYLPVSVNQKVSEINNVAFQTIGSEQGKTKISIGSGTYKFNVK